MTNEIDHLTVLSDVPAGARKPWVAPRIDDAAVLLRTHAVPSSSSSSVEIGTTKVGS